MFKIGDRVVRVALPPILLAFYEDGGEIGVSKGTLGTVLSGPLRHPDDMPGHLRYCVMWETGQHREPLEFVLEKILPPKQEKSTWDNVYNITGWRPQTLGVRVPS